MNDTNAKKIAAEKATGYIENDMVVGLGTGSTVQWAIQKIGRQIKDGLRIRAVVSSVQSEKLAKQSGIPIISFSEIDFIDLTIDGADQVDEKNNLIKGGGGALTREKILVYNSKQFIVVVDESKCSKQLGSFPLPVEIIQFASELTVQNLEQLGCKAKIRQAGSTNFITDNGNLIVDCSFTTIKKPAQLNTQIHLIPGVVETGLFDGEHVSKIIVGFKNGSLQVIEN